jgi:predicted HTH domain antitoxin
VGFYGELCMELVTVSKELQLATHLSAQEIRRELAISLYAQGKLSAGKARELAEMNVIEFQCLLGAHDVSISYGVEDFQDDLATIQQLKLDQ